MKNYIYLFFFIFSLCSTGCLRVTDPEPEPEPEIPELTPATMEGKHTLSFLLDGEVWVSDRGWGDLTSQVSVSGRNFSIDARKRQEFLSDRFSLGIIL